MTNVLTGSSLLKHEHHREQGNLVFDAAFYIEAPPKEVLSVLYDFDHVTRYMTIAPSVQLLGKGDDWQEVLYTYEALFLRIQAKFQRRLKEAANEIEFEMIECRQNIAWLPRVASFRGRYRVLPEGSGSTVEYHQEFRVEPQILSWIVPLRARAQLDEFIESLKRYLEGAVAGGNSD
jgi:carbon monoxide dehydrogenase subunit G